MIKLYDKDPYLTKCQSLVTACKQVKEGYEIRLDQSVFYPRGGGQPADKGTIDDIEVIDVSEDKNGHFHILPQPIEEGKSVECLLDWDFRLDSMEQHLGQHIFSAIAERDFGVLTTAARIEEGVSHVEFDKPLDFEQMYRLEQAVNKAIQDDLTVVWDFYSREQAEQMGLPAKAFTHENIRVVTIDTLDVNPCGGTHNASTGEVLGCVITGVKEVRGCYRIYYKFGHRYLDDRKEALFAALDVQKVLDVQDKTEVLAEITKLQDKSAYQAREINVLKAELLESDYKNMLALSQEKDGFVLICAHLDEKNYIKPVIDRIVLEHNALVLVTNKLGDTLSLILNQTKSLNKANMGATVRQFLSEIEGKGGGGPVNAQCNVAFSDGALDYAKELFDEIVKGL